MITFDARNKVIVTDTTKNELVSSLAGIDHVKATSDVSNELDLIAKIGQEIPAADMNNVNIAGSFLASVSFEYTEIITSRH